MRWHTLYALFGKSSNITLTTFLNIDFEIPAFTGINLLVFGMQWHTFSIV